MCMNEQFAFFGKKEQFSKEYQMVLNEETNHPSISFSGNFTDKQCKHNITSVFNWRGVCIRMTQP